MRGVRTCPQSTKPGRGRPKKGGGNAFTVQNAGPEWQSFKSKCNTEGRPYRRVLLELVRRYAEGLVSW